MSYIHYSYLSEENYFSVSDKDKILYRIPQCFILPSHKGKVSGKGQQIASHNKMGVIKERKC